MSQKPYQHRGYKLWSLRQKKSTCQSHKRTNKRTTNTVPTRMPSDALIRRNHGTKKPDRLAACLVFLSNSLRMRQNGISSSMSLKFAAGLAAGRGAAAALAGPAFWQVGRAS